MYRNNTLLKFTIVFISIYCWFFQVCQCKHVTTIKYCGDFHFSRSTGKIIKIPLTLKVPGNLTSNGNPIEFRLEKQTTKCPNKAINIKLNSKFSGFTSSGYLRIGSDFYDKGDYCIHGKNKYNIIVSVCPVDCGQSICIPKCCPPDQVEDIGQHRCSFSGQKHWSPTFYNEKTRLPENIHKLSHIHYIESKSRCISYPVPPIVGRDDMDEFKFNKKSIRLLRNGTLTIKSIGGWKPMSTLFCLDGIQNYGSTNNTKYYTGDETDFIVFRFAHCSTKNIRRKTNKKNTPSV